MKAMMLTALHEMELREIPAPALTRDTDVLLQVGVVGVCGSDVHYYKTGRIGSQVVQYPFLVGHEFSGVVLAAGRAVARLKPGDRVAVEPAMSCGACDQCRAGRRHTCRHLVFLGCPGQAEGCLCEQIVMPAECCHPVRPETSMERAAIAEPLSIGIYACQLAALPPQARIAILGCGPIGLSVMLPARLQGVAAVYATDKIEARLTVARRAGADWTGNPDREDIVGAILNREPLQLDAVFECCGQQAAMDQAVDLLKPGGTLMLVGIPEVDRVSFSIDKLRRKEIRIQNVRRQNECIQKAVDLIEQGAVNPDFMITHRFRLEQTREAFDLVENYRDGAVKAMIRVAE